MQPFVGALRMSVPEYMIRPRPVGVSILSVLHFIGGIVLGIGALVIWATLRDPHVAEKFRSLGVPVPLLVASIVLLATLSLASGFGMWSGARWGWYLGSFYCAYSIVRELHALFSIEDIFQSFPQEMPGHTVSFYYAKFGIRLLISTFIYLYFFKDSVREYFRLRESRRWVAVVVQFLLCIGLEVGASVWFNVSQ